LLAGARRFDALDLGALGVEVAHDVAGVGFGDDDVDLDDRLEQDHPAAAAASFNASAPASWKAMSDESTLWNLPSTSVHRMSTMGFPLITPDCIVLTTPFSTEPMNVFGIAPPKILSTNSNPSPRGRGSISMLQIAY
jgi:hypothetical protein